MMATKAIIAALALLKGIGWAEMIQVDCIRSGTAGLISNDRR